MQVYDYDPNWLTNDLYEQVCDYGINWLVNDLYEQVCVILTSIDWLMIFMFRFVIMTSFDMID